MRRCSLARATCGALFAAIVAASATAALAEACDHASKGLMLVHYEAGSLATTRQDQDKLARFADVARHHRGVCILGQVDAQGGDTTNEQLARSRAESIAGLLVRFGVPRDKIEIRLQQRGFTLWGLLEEDQPNDRRVKVAYW